MSQNRQIFDSWPWGNKDKASEPGTSEWQAVPRVMEDPAKGFLFMLPGASDALQVTLQLQS